MRPTVNPFSFPMKFQDGKGKSGRREISCSSPHHFFRPPAPPALSKASRPVCFQPCLENKNSPQARLPVSFTSEVLAPHHGDCVCIQVPFSEISHANNIPSAHSRRSVRNQRSMGITNPRFGRSNRPLSKVLVRISLRIHILSFPLTLLRERSDHANSTTLWSRKGIRDSRPTAIVLRFTLTRMFPGKMRASPRTNLMQEIRCQRPVVRGKPRGFPEFNLRWWRINEGEPRKKQLTHIGYLKLVRYLVDFEAG